MRALEACRCALVGVASFPLVACVDLFHSTDDILTACQIDATTPGCTPASDGSSPGIDAADARLPADFCDWTPAQAQAAARRTCAWLGACESPMGGNAFGACMIQALLAFDCAANPNHPVLGVAREGWACLVAATSCQDVSQCIFPAGPPACANAGDVTACSTALVGGAADSVRYECGGEAGGAVWGESCTLWGETCVSQGTAATCGGGTGCDAGVLASCDQDLTLVHWCGTDGEDLGLDCAGSGAGHCGGFPTSDASWTACVPLAAADASTSCDATLSVTCVNGTALSCPTGVPERVDCSALLGGWVDACSPGTLNPPFDWTSPCGLPEPCPADTCDGSVLTGCSRGATFSVDCAVEDLKPCRLVATDAGSEPHAACSPP
jgi:hypothetical protein